MRADLSSAKTAQTSASRHWDGRVPIILGAVGHRDVDTEDEKLIAALRKQCRALQKRYKHSPFIVLSALAEGADRLIAKAAMEELAADLIAVLPMPEEEYERDFKTEASKSGFKDFLDRALYIKIAPVSAEDASWKTDGEPRNVQYARAGAIIADHAQILFAIWDGKPAQGTGGTAQQVEWVLRGYSPNKYSLYQKALSPLDPLEPRRIIQIDPATADVHFAEGPEFTSPTRTSAKSDMPSILVRTDDYNRDVIRHKNTIESSPSLIPESAKNVKDLEITDLAYRTADSLSVHFSAQAKYSDSVIYALALGAVVVFNFISSKDYAPWIYLGITGIMAILAGRIWLRSTDNRFLEYRCLAEAFRTLIYWRSCGIMRPVWLAYLSRQTGVVHWIRHAVRCVEFCQDCLLPAEQKTDMSAVKLAKTAWVDNQKDWFNKKQRHHYNRYWAWKWVARLSIGASFVTAIILAVLTLLPSAEGGSLWDGWVRPDRLGDRWQVALGLFAAGGLAARGFLSRRAHLELAKQYASQGQIFETASRMLEKAATDPDAEWKPEEILGKLGEEALQEQAEWVWLRHTRPFEIPAA
jgi:hypothetical protein